MGCKKSMPSYSLAAMFMVISLVQHSCCVGRGQDLLVQIIQPDESVLEHYLIAEVEASCSKQSCSEFSQKGCEKKLLEKAECMGADAVLLMEVVVEGSGHAGAEIVGYECTGNAIRWKS